MNKLKLIKDLVGLVENLPIEQVERINLIVKGAISRLSEVSKKEKALQELIELGNVDETIETIQFVTELNLSGKELKKIPEGLKYLIHLRKLDLSNNQIQKIENLECLVLLQRLDLRNNQIKKVEGLEKCVHLQRLFLSNNLIEKVKGGLDPLLQLRVLYLKDNFLSWFSRVMLKISFQYKDLRV